MGKNAKKGRAQLYERVLGYFEQIMPNPSTELHYRNDYELLVAVMLSANCTDKRVNVVTPTLFYRWPDIESLAEADVDDVAQVIYSVNYHNTKAKHLVAMAALVCSDFEGRIPRTRDELTLLPGVGRKTANVMLVVAFGVPAMPVDTHVFRVSTRLGLVSKAKTPLEVERQLMDNIPPQLLCNAHHWLILFGRYFCKAVAPQCKECGLADICQKR